MPEKNKLNIVVSWMFLLYFAILIAERTQSIVRIIVSDDVGFFATAFDGFVNVVTTASVVLTVLCLACYKSFFRSLVDSTGLESPIALPALAALLLLGGMMHTEFTIAPIQFAAYGMLLGALLVRNIEQNSECSSKFKLWYCYVYLTVFSMAVPVMYHSYSEYAAIYHIFAAVTVFVLVGVFFIMMLSVMNGSGENLLSPFYIVPMIVLDAVTIGIRWKEEVNTFALIFAIASVVLFAIGKLIFRSSE